jgi:hypothetical protein
LAFAVPSHDEITKLSASQTVATRWAGINSGAEHRARRPPNFFVTASARRYL